MKAKILSFSVVVLVMVVLFFALSGLASGQGPVLTTLPTPTPVLVTPDTISSSDLTPQDLKPDLVVEKIETDPAIPLVGEPTVISVTIKNQGPGDVPPYNNFLTDLYIDPPIKPRVNYRQIFSPTLGLPWGAQWFFVPSGGSHVFTTTWVFTDVKTFDIWALVDSNGENEADSDGNVTETAEDNNHKKSSVSVLTAQSFAHDTHQDFLTNMASTLDNSHPDGVLRLGHFMEPPYFEWPFSNGCQIMSSTVAISDYNMQAPDVRINDVTTGSQVKPHLIANGEGIVVAVWEDGRNGDIINRDIYLRYSSDEGETWGPEVKVNDDGEYVDQSNLVAALSEDGNLLVAWQDLRNGDYDIYAQRFVISNTISGTTVIPPEANMLVGGADSDTSGDQISPDIAVDEAGGFYVVWQDNRNGNYDVFATSYISETGSYVWANPKRVNDDPNLTQQSNPAINVIDWLMVTGIEVTFGPAPDYEVTVIGVDSQPVTVLVVTWEDFRNLNADIAIAISLDGGDTFGPDDFINDDASPEGPPDLSAPDQLDPDVILTQDETIATISVTLPNGSPVPVEVLVPVTGIHTAWQDYRNSTPEYVDPDIYYSVSQFGVEQAASDTFDPQLSLGANQKINQDDFRNWQTSPVEQRDPALAVVPCVSSGGEEGWNMFITWADARNYDSANYDIFYTVKSTCDGMPEGLATNLMLANGVRLHNFDASDPSYDEYDAGHPPPGRQVNPSVAADIQTAWPYVSGGYLYLAWEDDRAGAPQIHKDIYFARSNLTYFNQYGPEPSYPGGLIWYGAGSQISNVLDSGREDTTWYTIDWSAATDDSTYVTVQTRLGDTITEVLASGWYPQRFEHQPQPWDCGTDGDEVGGDESGAPIPGYDAPGQHIEDAAGDFWPQARYIQYRVNFFTRDSTKTPELNNLTIHFDRNAHQSDDDDPGTVSFTYLPIVLK